MYKVLRGPEQLLNSDQFPEWCDLCTFFITKRPNIVVEVHYHNFEEIWLWFTGYASAWSEGIEFNLTPGVLLYAPPHRQHAFKKPEDGWNTLLVPRLRNGQTWGHRHLDETGETLVPQRNSILLTPAETGLDSTYTFPDGTCFRRVVAGELEPGRSVLSETTEAWIAVMPRLGSLSGSIDGDRVDVETEECLVVSAGTVVDIHAVGAADVVLVHGWPD